MLTRDESIAAVDYHRGLVIPDRLNQRTHAAY